MNTIEEMKATSNHAVNRWMNTDGILKDNGRFTTEQLTEIKYLFGEIITLGTLFLKKDGKLVRRTKTIPTTYSPATREELEETYIQFNKYVHRFNEIIDSVVAA